MTDLPPPIIQELAEPPGYERLIRTPEEAASPGEAGAAAARLDPKAFEAAPDWIDDAVHRAWSVIGKAPPAPDALKSPVASAPLTQAVAGPARASLPFSAVGRLILGYEGDRFQFCTGFVVAERLVATAAHCLDRADTGERAVFARFQPQYHAGAPLGEWAGQAAYIPFGWTNGGQGTRASPNDYALIRLDRPIVAQTGAVAILTGARPEGPVLSLGYPQKPNGDFWFDGRFLFQSHGALVPRYDVMLEAQNDLTEGSSGGPWFADWQGRAVVVGLNAQKTGAGGRTTESPPLDAAFLSLIAFAVADMTGA